MIRLIMFERAARRGFAKNIIQSYQTTVLPDRFVDVLRVLMHKSDAWDNDPDRSLALKTLNKPLAREGDEAFYGEDDLLYIRHIGTKTVSTVQILIDHLLLTS